MIDKIVVLSFCFVLPHGLKPILRVIPAKAGASLVGTNCLDGEFRLRGNDRGRGVRGGGELEHFKVDMR